MALTIKDRERPPRDLYALAYLCGGTSGLLTLYLYELVQQGHLEIVEIKKWHCTELRLVTARYRPPTPELTDISNGILEWFSEPQPPGDTYQRVLPKELKLHCLSYRDTLLERKLLKGWFLPERQIYFFRSALAINLASFLAARLLIGWPLGIIPTFSAAIVWISLGALLSLGIYETNRIRLSARGKRYVWRLKNKFDHLRDELKIASLGVLEANHRLAVAIFGVSALPRNSFYKFLEPLNFGRTQVYGTENGGALEDGGA